MLVTGRQGWEMQEGTRVDFPSHRPGNRWENSENPPETNTQRIIRKVTLEVDFEMKLGVSPHLELLLINTFTLNESIHCLVEHKTLGSSSG